MVQRSGGGLVADIIEEDNVTGSTAKRDSSGGWYVGEKLSPAEALSRQRGTVGLEIKDAIVCHL